MKKLLKNKKNIIIAASVFIVILLIIILIILITNKNDKDKDIDLGLNNIYDKEVITLYTNVVDVSCTGAWYLNIDIGEEEYLVSEMDNKDLLNYLFSYIAKFEVLSENIKISKIDEITEKLFYGNIKLTDKIENYSYDEYVYSYKGEQLVRKATKCDDSIFYVNDLNGYYYFEDKLYLNVNIGYVKNNVLYDLLDNRLGIYKNDSVELKELFKNNPYYKYTYIKDKETYKLYSVQLKSKI